MRRVIFPVLLATGLISSVGAQESGGVRLGGNNRINANAQNVNTIAAGSDNTARTAIGAVKPGAKGNVDVTVDVKNVTNIAAGRGRKSCVNIGTVGDASCK